MYVGWSYWDDGTALSEGDDVIVQGEVTEYYGWTEITDVDSITATGTSTASNIVPISVTTGTLGDSCNVLGEAYESVLVTLSGVGMMEAANGYGEITINDGTGPTQLEDGILNTDATFETGFCFPVSPATTWDYVGTNITTLTGVIKYSYGSYEVHPRTMDDIDYAPDGCEMSPSPSESPTPSPTYPCSYTGPTWMWFGGYEGAAQSSYSSGSYTWDSANDFCAGLGGQLCTFDQMCSGGNQGDLDQTVANFWSFPGAMTGDNWAPYRDTQYYWLNTGSARECHQEGGSSSSWHGMSWCCSDAFLCCDIPCVTPSPTATLAPTISSAPTPTASRWFMGEITCGSNIVVRGAAVETGASVRDPPYSRLRAGQQRRGALRERARGAGPHLRVHGQHDRERARLDVRVAVRHARQPLPRHQRDGHDV